MLATAGSASAATYPDGGSGFGQGTEGWSAGGASCTPAELFCSAEADYDAANGNPPGSIAAKTNVTLNLVSLFKGTVIWNSPKFTVPVEPIIGAQTSLDRAFDPGGLVDVEPEASYTVTLTDLTTGTSTTALSGEASEEDEVFETDSAPVAVVGGHEYRLSIEAVTAQSTLALSLVSGTTSLRFDNIGLTVRSSTGGKGGGSGDKGSGSNSPSDRRLFSLLSNGGALGAAVLKGNQLFVRVGCPAKVGHACRITAQGLLAKRKRLLVPEKVRAGAARATVYKQRKLIRKG